MLVSYMVNIRTDADTAETDDSAGFSGGSYRFSTAPVAGCLQCLDGSSFSAVRQQNAIICGGELSTMGTVEITVASKPVLTHIRRNGINLLGGKVNMSYKLEGRHSESVFSNMRIASFTEKSETTFAIALEDSCFDRASPCLLRQPASENENDIATRIGESVWLPLKKSSARKSYCGQGQLATGELELPLPRKNGKICFPRSFPLHMGYIPFGPGAFVIGETGDPLAPSCEGLREGMTVEIYAGKGAGDKYKIEGFSRARGKMELLVSPNCGGKVQGIYGYRQPLRPLTGSIFSLYGTTLPSHPQIVFPSENDSWSKDLKDVSFWRIGDSDQVYYIPLWKKTVLREGFHAVGATNAEGGIETICLMNLVPMETGDGYQLFIDRSNAMLEDKISLTGIVPVAPRYDMKRGATCILPHFNDSNPEFKTFRVDCEAAQLSSPSRMAGYEQSVVFKILPAGRLPGKLDVIPCDAQIAVFWRMDEIGSMENVDTIYPHFLAGTNYAKWQPVARAMLLDDSMTVMEVKDYPGPDENSSLITGMMEWMPERMRNALTFEKSSLANAKYLYLQIGMGFTDVYKGKEGCDISFFTYGLIRKRSYPLDKARVKAMREDAIRNPVQLARTLCEDNDIPTDSESMGKASLAMQKDIYAKQALSYEMPSIEVANGALWEEKLSELCRAANFSLFSDGSTLHAKYWIADRLENDAESWWEISGKDIVADTYSMASLKNEGIATDYSFSVPTEGGIKTLLLSAPGKDDALSSGGIYADGDVLDVDPSSCRVLHASKSDFTFLMSVRSAESAVLMPGLPYE